jgi:DNA-binding LacI/PurR family transcriptional regulator
VLNDQPMVRPETRDRVLAAIRQLDYRPSVAARALNTGRTRALGVITFDATRYGPVSVLHGIGEAAWDSGYLVSTVALRRPDRDSVLETMRRLVDQAVDGIIVIAARESVARAVCEMPRQVPLVILDNSFNGQVPTVGVDELLGARQATRHLLGLGHRTVWHLAGPAQWIAAQGRLVGWEAALLQAGAVVPAPVSGDWSADSGYRLGRELARRPEVTAIFAGNDQMALGLLRALREAGRRVPQDVSVVGYDDIPEAAYLVPPLTTVRPDFAEVGRRCIATVLDQLDAPRHAVRVVVPTQLIVRDSSGPPPR